MIRLGDKSGKLSRLAVLALLGLLLGQCACLCNFPSTFPLGLTPSGQVKETGTVAWIGSGGGEISHPSGARVIIPEGTLNQDIQITVSQAQSIPDLPADLPVELAGPAYELALSEEIVLMDLLEVHLPLDGQPDLDPTAYAVFLWDGSGWYDVAGFVEEDIIRTYIPRVSLIVPVTVRGVGRRPVRFSPCAHAGIRNMRIIVATYDPSPDMAWVPIAAATPCSEQGHGYMVLPLGLYTFCVQYIDEYEEEPECYWDGIGFKPDTGQMSHYWPYTVHDGLPKDIRNAYPIDYETIPPGLSLPRDHVHPPYMIILEDFCGRQPECPVGGLPSSVAVGNLHAHWFGDGAADSGAPGPATPSGRAFNPEGWFTDANAERHCNELMPGSARLAQAYVDEYEGEPALRCESALDDDPIFDIVLIVYASDTDAVGGWREWTDIFDELMAEGNFDLPEVLVAERTETEMLTVQYYQDYGYDVFLQTIYGNCLISVLEDGAPDPGEADARAIVNTAKRLIDQLRGN